MPWHPLALSLLIASIAWIHLPQARTDSTTRPSDATQSELDRVGDVSIPSSDGYAEATTCKLTDTTKGNDSTNDEEAFLARDEGPIEGNKKVGFVDVKWFNHLDRFIPATLLSRLNIKDKDGRQSGRQNEESRLSEAEGTRTKPLAPINAVYQILLDDNPGLVAKLLKKFLHHSGDESDANPLSSEEANAETASAEHGHDKIEESTASNDRVPFMPDNIDKNDSAKVLMAVLNSLMNMPAVTSDPRHGVNEKSTSTQTDSVTESERAANRIQMTSTDKTNPSIIIDDSRTNSATAENANPSDVKMVKIVNSSRALNSQDSANSSKITDSSGVKTENSGNGDVALDEIMKSLLNILASTDFLDGDRRVSNHSSFAEYIMMNSPQLFGVRLDKTEAKDNQTDKETFDINNLASSLSRHQFSNRINDDGSKKLKNAKDSKTLNSGLLLSLLDEPDSLKLSFKDFFKSLLFNLANDDANDQNKNQLNEKDSGSAGNDDSTPYNSNIRECLENNSEDETLATELPALDKTYIDYENLTPSSSESSSPVSSQSKASDDGTFNVLDWSRDFGLETYQAANVTRTDDTSTNNLTRKKSKQLDQTIGEELSNLSVVSDKALEYSKENLKINSSSNISVSNEPITESGSTEDIGSKESWYQVDQSSPPTDENPKAYLAENDPQSLNDTTFINLSRRYIKQLEGALNDEISKLSVVTEKAFEYIKENLKINDLSNISMSNEPITEASPAEKRISKAFTNRSLPQLEQSTTPKSDGTSKSKRAANASKLSISASLKRVRRKQNKQLDGTIDDELSKLSVVTEKAFEYVKENLKINNLSNISMSGAPVTEASSTEVWISRDHNRTLQPHAVQTTASVIELNSKFIEVAIVSKPLKDTSWKHLPRKKCKQLDGTIDDELSNLSVVTEQSFEYVKENLKMNNLTNISISGLPVSEAGSTEDRFLKELEIRAQSQVIQSTPSIMECLSTQSVNDSASANGTSLKTIPRKKTKQLDGALDDELSQLSVITEKALEYVKENLKVNELSNISMSNKPVTEASSAGHRMSENHPDKSLPTEEQTTVTALVRDSNLKSNRAETAFKSLNDTSSKNMTNKNTKQLEDSLDDELLNLSVVTENALEYIKENLKIKNSSNISISNNPNTEANSKVRISKELIERSQSQVDQSTPPVINLNTRSKRAEIASKQSKGTSSKNLTNITNKQLDDSLSDELSNLSVVTEQALEYIKENLKINNLSNISMSGVPVTESNSTENRISKEPIAKSLPQEDHSTPADMELNWKSKRAALASKSPKGTSSNNVPNKNNKQLDDSLDNELSNLSVFTEKAFEYIKENLKMKNVSNISMSGVPVPSMSNNPITEASSTDMILMEPIVRSQSQVIYNFNLQSQSTTPVTDLTSNSKRAVVVSKSSKDGTSKVIMGKNSKQLDESLGDELSNLSIVTEKALEYGKDNLKIKILSNISMSYPNTVDSTTEKSVSEELKHRSPPQVDQSSPAVDLNSKSNDGAIVSKPLKDTSWKQLLKRRSKQVDGTIADELSKLSVVTEKSFEYIKENLKVNNLSNISIGGLPVTEASSAEDGFLKGLEIRSKSQVIQSTMPMMNCSNYRTENDSLSTNGITLKALPRKKTKQLDGTLNDELSQLSVVTEKAFEYVKENLKINELSNISMSGKPVTEASSAEDTTSKELTDKAPPEVKQSTELIVDSKMNNFPDISSSNVPVTEASYTALRIPEDLTSKSHLSFVQTTPIFDVLTLKCKCNHRKVTSKSFKGSSRNETENSEPGDDTLRDDLSNLSIVTETALQYIKENLKINNLSNISTSGKAVTEASSDERRDAWNLTLILQPQTEQTTPVIELNLRSKRDSKSSKGTSSKNVPSKNSKQLDDSVNDELLNLSIVTEKAFEYIKENLKINNLSNISMGGVPVTEANSPENRISKKGLAKKSLPQVDQSTSMTDITSKPNRAAIVTKSSKDTSSKKNTKQLDDSLDDELLNLSVVTEKGFEYVKENLKINNLSNVSISGVPNTEGNSTDRILKQPQVDQSTTPAIELNAKSKRALASKSSKGSSSNNATDKNCKQMQDSLSDEFSSLSIVTAKALEYVKENLKINNLSNISISNTPAAEDSTTLKSISEVLKHRSLPELDQTTLSVTDLESQTPDWEIGLKSNGTVSKYFKIKNNKQLDGTLDDELRNLSIVTEKALEYVKENLKINNLSNISMSNKPVMEGSSPEDMISKELFNKSLSQGQSIPPLIDPKLKFKRAGIASDSSKGSLSKNVTNNNREQPDDLRDLSKLTLVTENALEYNKEHLKVNKLSNMSMSNKPVTEASTTDKRIYNELARKSTTPVSDLNSRSKRAVISKLSMSAQSKRLASKNIKELDNPLPEGFNNLTVVTENSLEYSKENLKVNSMSNISMSNKPVTEASGAGNVSSEDVVIRSQPRENQTTPPEMDQGLKINRAAEDSESKIGPSLRFLPKKKCKQLDGTIDDELPQLSVVTQKAFEYVKENLKVNELSNIWMTNKPVTEASSAGHRMSENISDKSLPSVDQTTVATLARDSKSNRAVTASKLSKDTSSKNVTNKNIKQHDDSLGDELSELSVVTEKAFEYVKENLKIKNLSNISMSNNANTEATSTERISKEINDRSQPRVDQSTPPVINLNTRSKRAEIASKQSKGTSSKNLTNKNNKQLGDTHSDGFPNLNVVTEQAFEYIKENLKINNLSNISMSKAPVTEASPEGSGSSPEVRISKKLSNKSLPQIDQSTPSGIDLNLKSYRAAIASKSSINVTNKNTEVDDSLSDDLLNLSVVTEKAFEYVKENLKVNELSNVSMSGKPVTEASSAEHRMSENITEKSLPTVDQTTATLLRDSESNRAVTASKSKNTSSKNVTNKNTEQLEDSLSDEVMNLTVVTEQTLEYMKENLKINNLSNISISNKPVTEASAAERKMSENLTGKSLAQADQSTPSVIDLKSRSRRTANASKFPKGTSAKKATNKNNKQLDDSVDEELSLSVVTEKGFEYMKENLKINNLSNISMSMPVTEASSTDFRTSKELVIKSHPRVEMSTPSLIDCNSKFNRAAIVTKSSKDTSSKNTISKSSKQLDDSVSDEISNLSVVTAKGFEYVKENVKINSVSNISMSGKQVTEASSTEFWISKEHINRSLPMSDLNSKTNGAVSDSESTHGPIVKHLPRKQKQLINTISNKLSNLREVTERALDYNKENIEIRDLSNIGMRQPDAQRTYAANAISMEVAHRSHTRVDQITSPLEDSASKNDVTIVSKPLRATSWRNLPRRSSNKIDGKLSHGFSYRASGESAFNYIKDNRRINLSNISKRNKASSPENKISNNLNKSQPQVDLSATPAIDPNSVSNRVAITPKSSKDTCRKKSTGKNNKQLDGTLDDELSTLTLVTENALEYIKENLKVNELSNISMSNKPITETSSTESRNSKAFTNRCQPQVDQSTTPVSDANSKSSRKAIASKPSEGTSSKNVTNKNNKQLDDSLSDEVFNLSVVTENAIEYMKENLKINNLSNISISNEQVSEASSTEDRNLMPLALKSQPLVDQTTPKIDLNSRHDRTTDCTSSGSSLIDLSRNSNEPIDGTLSKGFSDRNVLPDSASESRNEKVNSSNISTSQSLLEPNSTVNTKFRNLKLKYQTRVEETPATIELVPKSTTVNISKSLNGTSMMYLSRNYDSQRDGVSEGLSDSSVTETVFEFVKENFKINTLSDVSTGKRLLHIGPTENRVSEELSNRSQPQVLQTNKNSNSNSSAIVSKSSKATSSKNVTGKNSKQLDDSLSDEFPNLSVVTEQAFEYIKENLKINNLSNISMSGVPVTEGNTPENRISKELVAKSLPQVGHSTQAVVELIANSKRAALAPKSPKHSPSTKIPNNYKQKDDSLDDEISNLSVVTEKAFEYVKENLKVNELSNISMSGVPVTEGTSTDFRISKELIIKSLPKVDQSTPSTINFNSKSNRAALASKQSKGTSSKNVPNKSNKQLDDSLSDEFPNLNVVTEQAFEYIKENLKIKNLSNVSMSGVPVTEASSPEDGISKKLSNKSLPQLDHSTSSVSELNSKSKRAVTGSSLKSTSSTNVKNKNNKQLDDSLNDELQNLSVITEKAFEYVKENLKINNLSNISMSINQVTDASSTVMISKEHSDGSTPKVEQSTAMIDSHSRFSRSLDHSSSGSLQRSIRHDDSLTFAEGFLNYSVATENALDYVKQVKVNFMSNISMNKSVTDSSSSSVPVTESSSSRSVNIGSSSGSVAEGSSSVDSVSTELLRTSEAQSLVETDVSASSITDSYNFTSSTPLYVIQNFNKSKPTTTESVLSNVIRSHGLNSVDVSLEKPTLSIRKRSSESDEMTTTNYVDTVVSWPVILLNYSDRINVSSNCAPFVLKSLYNFTNLPNLFTKSDALSKGLTDYIESLISNVSNVDLTSLKDLMLSHNTFNCSNDNCSNTLKYSAIFRNGSKVVDSTNSTDSKTSGNVSNRLSNISTSTNYPLDLTNVTVKSDRHKRDAESSDASNRNSKKPNNHDVKTRRKKVSFIDKFFQKIGLRKSSDESEDAGKTENISNAKVSTKAPKRVKASKSKTTAGFNLSNYTGGNELGLDSKFTIAVPDARLTTYLSSDGEHLPFTICVPQYTVRIMSDSFANYSLRCTDSSAENATGSSATRPDLNELTPSAVTQSGVLPTTVRTTGIQPRTGFSNESPAEPPRSSTVESARNELSSKNQTLLLSSSLTDSVKATEDNRAKLDSTEQAVFSNQSSNSYNSLATTTETDEQNDFRSKSSDISGICSPFSLEESTTTRNEFVLSRKIKITYDDTALLSKKINTVESSTESIDRDVIQETGAAVNPMSELNTEKNDDGEQWNGFWIEKNEENVSFEFHDSTSSYATTELTNTNDDSMKLEHLDGKESSLPELDGASSLTSPRNDEDSDSGSMVSDDMTQAYTSGFDNSMDFANFPTEVPFGNENSDESVTQIVGLLDETLQLSNVENELSPVLTTEAFYDGDRVTAAQTYESAEDLLDRISSDLQILTDLKQDVQVTTFRLGDLSVTSAAEPASVADNENFSLLPITGKVFHFEVITNSSVDLEYKLNEAHSPEHSLSHNMTIELLKDDATVQNETDLCFSFVDSVDTDFNAANNVSNQNAVVGQTTGSELKSLATEDAEIATQKYSTNQFFVFSETLVEGNDTGESNSEMIKFEIKEEKEISVGMKQADTTKRLESLNNSKDKKSHTDDTTNKLSNFLTTQSAPMTNVRTGDVMSTTDSSKLPAITRDSSAETKLVEQYSESIPPSDNLKIAIMTSSEKAGGDSISTSESVSESNLASNRNLNESESKPINVSLSVTTVTNYKLLASGKNEVDSKTESFTSSSKNVELATESAPEMSITRPIVGTENLRSTVNKSGSEKPQNSPTIEPDKGSETVMNSKLMAKSDNVTSALKGKLVGSTGKSTAVDEELHNSVATKKLFFSTAANKQEDLKMLIVTTQEYSDKHLKQKFGDLNTKKTFDTVALLNFKNAEESAKGHNASSKLSLEYDSTTNQLLVRNDVEQKTEAASRNVNSLGTKPTKASKTNQMSDSTKPSLSGMHDLHVNLSKSGNRSAGDLDGLVERMRHENNESNRDSAATQVISTEAASVSSLFSLQTKTHTDGLKLGSTKSHCSDSKVTEKPGNNGSTGVDRHLDNVLKPDINSKVLSARIESVTSPPGHLYLGQMSRFDSEYRTTWNSDAVAKNVKQTNDYKQPNPKGKSDEIEANNTPAGIADREMLHSIEHNPDGFLRLEETKSNFIESSPHKNWNGGAEITESSELPVKQDEMTSSNRSKARVTRYFISKKSYSQNLSPDQRVFVLSPTPRLNATITTYQLSDGNGVCTTPSVQQIKQFMVEAIFPTVDYLDNSTTSYRDKSLSEANSNSFRTNSSANFSDFVTAFSPVEEVTANATNEISDESTRSTEMQIKSIVDAAGIRLESSTQSRHKQTSNLSNSPIRNNSESRLERPTFYVRNESSSTLPPSLPSNMNDQLKSFTLSYDKKIHGEFKQKFDSTTKTNLVSETSSRNNIFQNGDDKTSRLKTSSSFLTTGDSTKHSQIQLSTKSTPLEPTSSTDNSQTRSVTARLGQTETALNSILKELKRFENQSLNSLTYDALCRIDEINKMINDPLLLLRTTPPSANASQYQTLANASQYQTLKKTVQLEIGSNLFNESKSPLQLNYQVPNSTIKPNNSQWFEFKLFIDLDQAGSGTAGTNRATLPMVTQTQSYVASTEKAQTSSESNSVLNPTLISTDSDSINLRLTGSTARRPTETLSSPKPFEEPITETSSSSGSPLKTTSDVKLDEIKPTNRKGIDISASITQPGDMLYTLTMGNSSIGANQMERSSERYSSTTVDSNEKMLSTQSELPNIADYSAMKVESITSQNQLLNSGYSSTKVEFDKKIISTQNILETIEYSTSKVERNEKLNSTRVESLKMIETSTNKAEFDEKRMSTQIVSQNIENSTSEVEFDEKMFSIPYELLNGEFSTNVDFDEWKPSTQKELPTDTESPTNENIYDEMFGEQGELMNGDSSTNEDEFDDKMFSAPDELRDIGESSTSKGELNRKNISARGESPNRVKRHSINEEILNIKDELLNLGEDSTIPVDVVVKKRGAEYNQLDVSRHSTTTSKTEVNEKLNSCCRSSNHFPSSTTTVIDSVDSIMNLTDNDLINQFKKESLDNPLDEIFSSEILTEMPNELRVELTVMPNNYITSRKNYSTNNSNRNHSSTRPANSNELGFNYKEMNSTSKVMDEKFGNKSWVGGQSKQNAFGSGGFTTNLPGPSFEFLTNPSLNGSFLSMKSQKLFNTDLTDVPHFPNCSFTKTPITLGKMKITDYLKIPADGKSRHVPSGVKDAASPPPPFLHNPVTRAEFKSNLLKPIVQTGSSMDSFGAMYDSMFKFSTKRPDGYFKPGVQIKNSLDLAKTAENPISGAANPIRIVTEGRYLLLVKSPKTSTGSYGSQRNSSDDFSPNPLRFRTRKIPDSQWTTAPSTDSSLEPSTPAGSDDRSRSLDPIAGVASTDSVSKELDNLSGYSSADTPLAIASTESVTISSDDVLMEEPLEFSAASSYSKPLKRAKRKVKTGKNGKRKTTTASSMDPFADTMVHVCDNIVEILAEENYFNQNDENAESASSVSTPTATAQTFVRKCTEQPTESANTVDDDISLNSVTDLLAIVNEMERVGGDSLNNYLDQCLDSFQTSTSKSILQSFLGVEPIDRLLQSVSNNKKSFFNDSELLDSASLNRNYSKRNASRNSTEPLKDESNFTTSESTNPLKNVDNFKKDKFKFKSSDESRYSRNKRHLDKSTAALQSKPLSSSSSDKYIFVHGDRRSKNNILNGYDASERRLGNKGETVLINTGRIHDPKARCYKCFQLENQRSLVNFEKRKLLSNFLKSKHSPPLNHSEMSNFNSNLLNDESYCKFQKLRETLFKSGHKKIKNDLENINKKILQDRNRSRRFFTKLYKGFLRGKILDGTNMNYYLKDAQIPTIDGTNSVQSTTETVSGAAATDGRSTTEVFTQVEGDDDTMDPLLKLIFDVSSTVEPNKMVDVIEAGLTTTPETNTNENDCEVKAPNELKNDSAARFRNSDFGQRATNRFHVKRADCWAQECGVSATESRMIGDVVAGVESNAGHVVRCSKATGDRRNRAAAAAAEAGHLLRDWGKDNNSFVFPFYSKVEGPMRGRVITANPPPKTLTYHLSQLVFTDNRNGTASMLHLDLKVTTKNFSLASPRKSKYSCSYLTDDSDRPMVFVQYSPQHRLQTDFTMDPDRFSSFFVRRADKSADQRYDYIVLNLKNLFFITIDLKTQMDLYKDKAEPVRSNQLLKLLPAVYNKYIANIDALNPNPDLFQRNKLKMDINISHF